MLTNIVFKHEYQDNLSLRIQGAENIFKKLFIKTETTLGGRAWKFIFKNEVQRCGKFTFLLD